MVYSTDQKTVETVRISRSPLQHLNELRCLEFGHSLYQIPPTFSWWIVQVQPTNEGGWNALNPTNFSWWIVQVQPTQERAGDSRFVSSSLPSRREGRAR